MISKEYKARKQREYRQRHPEYNKKWNITGIKKQIRDILGNRCKVCGWRGVCHVHHLDLVKKNKRDYQVSKAKEYVLLCPNHHKELHSVVGSMN